MYQFLLNLVDLNEGINFKLIFILLVGYIFLLWMIVILWVYFDAKKRYLGTFQPFLLAIASFFLGIPFIAFYLLVRPDIHQDFGYFGGNNENEGGVNIPMINFVGDEGVEMTLNLTVSRKVASLKPSDLKIDVNIEPKDDKFEVKEMKEVDKIMQETLAIDNNIGKKYGRFNLLSGLREKLRKMNEELKERSKKKQEMKEKFEISSIVKERELTLNLEKRNKHKKKKHKRK